MRILDFFDFPKIVRTKTHNNSFGRANQWSLGQANEEEKNDMLQLKQQYEKEVEDATKWVPAQFLGIWLLTISRLLLSSTIPTFAAWLTDQFGSVERMTAAEYSYLLEGDWLSIVTHFHGINVRYLGMVRAQLPASTPNYIHIWICVELIARALKNSLRARLREAMIKLRYTGEEPYKKYVPPHTVTS